MSSDFTARQRAREALEAANEAKDMAGERLDGVSHNRFITFKDYYMKKVKTGWFSSKEVLSEQYVTRSIKFTDIAHLESSQDDEGNPYTKVVLESRCDLVEMEGIPYLAIKDSIEKVQTLVNGG